MRADNLLDTLVDFPNIGRCAVLVTGAAATLFRGRRGTVRLISGMLEMHLGALVA